MHRIPFALRAPADAAGGTAPAPTAMTAPTPAPAAAPVAFAETLPEEYRNHPSLRDIKNLPALVKSYVSATEMVGGRREDFIRLPGADDAEGWNGVFGRLGRPEKPDGYEFKAPDGVTVDPALQGAFGDTAHKLGLTKAQAAGLYDWFNGQSGSAAQAAEQARLDREQAGIAALQREWGAAFNDKLAAAKAAVNTLAGDEFAAYLNETRLGNDPRMIKLMAQIGANLAEDGKLPGGGGGPGNGPLSPAEARQQIAALTQDKGFMEQYLRGPDHTRKAAVERMARLHQFANPPRQ